MGVDKNLSDALGIDHLPANKEVDFGPDLGKEVVTYHPDQVDESNDQQEDYILARKTLRNLIEKGNDAIDEITLIAKQSESARAFEVVSTLIKTVGETTKDLYQLQKMTKDLKQPDSSSDPRKKGNESINVEQAVFVGSTAELLSAIKKQKEEELKTIES